VAAGVGGAAAEVESVSKGLGGVAVGIVGDTWRCGGGRWQWWSRLLLGGAIV